MKPDARLHADILEELEWQPSVNAAEIVVDVKDGVATLTGAVDSYAGKRTAERAVERVSGVRAVVSHLRVNVPSTVERSDAEIASAASSALDRYIEVPAGVRAKVDQGWVTLDGTVEWQFEKAAAERAVRSLRGVRGLTNQLTVQPKYVSVYDVSQAIAGALRRRAKLDADRITVEAADGKVTLRGTVRSPSERRDAETAAWSARGVTHVGNRLEISS